MTYGNTSKLFIPYLSQFRVTYQKARRSVKKRIESKVPEKSTQEIDAHNSRSDIRLSDVKFEVLPEDFVGKVKDPQLLALFILPSFFHFFMNSFDYKDSSPNNEVLFASYCCVRYFHKRKK